jgi:predicted extracellular nuclease
VEVVSIYDIQFTTDPGFDGTYPSPFVNQTVIVQGVVTATGFQGNRAFISEPRGGAWSGIAVDGIGSRVNVGDFIQVQGRVSEIMGMTVITNTRDLSVLLRNTPLPSPVHVSVHEALTSEAYESVLVQISNVTCRSVTNGNFIAALEDGSSRISVGNGFSTNIGDLFRVGDNYSTIVGIINFSFNQFSIHPRSANDVRNDTTGIQSQSWGRIKSMYR